MGQVGAKEQDELLDTAIRKLSEVELGEIGSRFNELYVKGGKEGRILNREEFAKHFNLPIVLGDRLFAAFDADGTGSLTFREFAAGLSLCLNGSLPEKRALLFRMFNMSNDEGVSRHELATMLNSTLKSAYTILHCVSDDESALLKGTTLQMTVESVVKEAFEKCDISKSGKLLPVEFEYWLSQNCQLTESIFGRVCSDLSSKREFPETQLTVPERFEEREEDQQESVTTAKLEEKEVEEENLLAIEEDYFSTPQTSAKPAEDESDGRRLDRLKKKLKGFSPKLTEVPIQDKPTEEVGISSPESPLLPVGSPTQPDLDPDNSHSYWPPSESTRQLLNACLSGLPSVDPRYLTAPGISIEGPDVDPIGELLKKYGMDVDSLRRSMLTSNSVVPDSRGFQQLVADGHYRAALDLTGKFLAANGQGTEGRSLIRALHTHKTLQVWFCRIALLCKLKMYSVALTELEAFRDFDQPDLYFEYHPEIYPEKRGSLVPFALRVLAAELPQHIGKHQEALDKLYQLRHVCGKVVDNLSSGLAHDGSQLTRNDEEERLSLLSLWNQRKTQLLYSIGNCFINLKDYRLAVSVFESLLEIDSANKINILSGIGRIYLQLGDIQSAKEVFLTIEKTSPSHEPVIETNSAFVCVSLGQYGKAADHFQALVAKDPKNAVAVNNLSVCLLYQGRLKEALTVLEEAIWKNPADLQESLLFNLCTAYELESSKTMQKKKAMLELAAKYSTDNLNADCLKLG